MGDSRGEKTDREDEHDEEGEAGHGRRLTRRKAESRQVATVGGDGTEGHKASWSWALWKNSEVCAASCAENEQRPNKLVTTVSRRGPAPVCECERRPVLQ